MSVYENLNDNPELLAWLQGLEKTVQSRNEGKSGNNEPRIFLPKIRMNKKMTQVNNKTYPEMQGSINFLPVPWKGQRVVELSNVITVWCPSDVEWNSGYMYNILPSNFYPEGEVRDRINNIRSTLLNLLNEGKVDWKYVKKRNYSLIKAFVLMHRNTKGDVVSSNLYGGDSVIEHKNVPALLIFPVNRVQDAIQDDLNGKMNPVPFAVACYSDTPLKDRKGWVSITFKDKEGNAIGYKVTVTTELVNPVVMTDNLIPSDVNMEDERIKLLDTCDPIKEMLDRRQVGTEEGQYWNNESLELLESYVNSLVK